jgi:hypothetical protein
LACWPPAPVPTATGTLLEFVFMLQSRPGHLNRLK